MLRIHEDTGPVIGLWTDGDPTSEQLSDINGALKRRIASSGRVKLLVRIRSTETWSASALLDILGLSQTFGRGVEKIAIVGRKCSDCTQDLIAVVYQRIAFFNSDRLEAAWRWISASPDEDVFSDVGSRS